MGTCTRTLMRMQRVRILCSGCREKVAKHKSEQHEAHNKQIIERLERTNPPRPRPMPTPEFKANIVVAPSLWPEGKLLLFLNRANLHLFKQQQQTQQPDGHHGMTGENWRRSGSWRTINCFYYLYIHGNEAVNTQIL